MSTITRKNFSGNPDPPKADEYVACNFCQPQPVGNPPVGVRLFPGDDTPRIFRNCNLSNCTVPPGSTIDGGNTAIVERDVIHRTDRVLVDGQLVARVRTRKAIVHGRVIRETLEVERRETPEEIIDTDGREND